MRALLTNLLVLLGTLAVQAQGVFIDRAPSQGHNMRAVEGGSRPVFIDTVTALETLLKRLNTNWQLVATGKSYWIGYTDDMYSIAAHKNAAIKPLLLFARNSANDQGKVGVAYCLHLIGINSRIAGRTYEEFVNKPARQALLSLLADPQLTEEVVHLLLRDPWQSDVPALVAALQQAPADSWALVAALSFYGLPNLPIRQALPPGVEEVSVKCPPVPQYTFAERRMAEARHELDSYDKQVSNVLQAITALHRSAIQVEDSLLQAKQFWGRWMIEFSPGGKKISIRAFLEDMAESRVQYFVEHEVLTICTVATAKQRLTKWWDNQPQAYKTQFTQDKAAATNQSYLRVGF